MPDITMCSNNDCPLSESCYRFKCTPNEYWQSYSKFTPTEVDDTVECEYYIELDKK